MSELKMARCTGCSRPIPPNDVGTVRFGCPVCDYPLVRGSKCRKLGNTYKCPNCGFIGP